MDKKRVIKGVMKTTGEAEVQAITEIANATKRIEVQ